MFVTGCTLPGMPMDSTLPMNDFAIAPAEADLHARIAALEAENAALAAQLRARDDFLTHAAHELRNPMTPIMGQVQLMRRQLEIGALPAGGMEAGLARLEWVIGRYIRRATTLLDMTRLNAGRLQLRPVRTPLGPLVAQVVEDLRIPAVQAGAVIAVDIPEPITGLWDRLSVEQVLDNLLSNAIKYGAGSPITVSAWVDGTEAHMMVADGGPGLAEAEQARIFEQFERGQGTGRRTGFGVGLWIVRELASAMGGDVALRSAPGQGAAFTLTLPLEPPG